MRAPLAFALVTGLCVPVLAQEVAAPVPKFSVQTSRMGDLVADPVAGPVFLRHFPEIVNHPQFNEGAHLTLPEVVQYVPDILTPEKLAAMDAELKALPQ